MKTCGFRGGSENLSITLTIPFESGRKEQDLKAGKTAQENPPIHPLLSVSVYSLEGLEGALAGGADCIYFGEGLFRRPETAGQKESYAEGFEHL